MTDVEAAQATKAELEAKLETAHARRKALAEERQSLAFAAHTGDAKSRKRLDDANAASATIDLEIENLRSAIDEAQRRINEASAAEERAELAGKAERALQIAKDLGELGCQIDAALATIGEHARAYKGKLDELKRLGAAHPNAGQFLALGTRALHAAMMDTPLKLDHLAPGERRSFTEIADGHVATIKNWAEPRLAKAAPKAEAA